MTLNKAVGRAAGQMVFGAALACGFLLISNVTVGFAHQGATGIVKQRMDAMKSVAAATKVLATLDWSNLEVARKKAAENARVVSGHAAQMVKLFPQGSMMGPSEAAPAIWSKPEAFAKLATDMGSAADQIVALAPTANSRADIVEPFNAMAATCKACHADYRTKR